MTTRPRLPAAAAYIPVIGWLYVYLFQRKNELAVYHLRQSIGLAAALIGVLLAWIVAAWVLAWIPYFSILSAGLFTLVMAAYLAGAVAWVVGIIRALRDRLEPLPMVGSWASRLPIG